MKMQILTDKNTNSTVGGTGFLFGRIDFLTIDCHFLTYCIKLLMKTFLNNENYYVGFH